MTSIDALLSQHAKNLKPGESLSFVLVKGPTSKNSAASVKADGTTQLAPELTFPKVAKFITTVVPPNFNATAPVMTMYEEDKPKARDSDDEEIEERLKKMRRRRFKRNSDPKRHWVLHEKTPQRQQLPKDETNPEWLSRYEGNPEFNSSNYAMMSVAVPTGDSNSNSANVTSKQQCIQVDIAHGFQSFSQPHKLQALNGLSEAAAHIQNQKGVLKAMQREAKRPGAINKGNTKLRLLDKLSRGPADATEQDYGADDVMADVSFRDAKISVSSRREILQVSDDLVVDGEGVLGGANDVEFGGRRSFGRLTRRDDDDDDNGEGDNGNTRRGKKSAMGSGYSGAVSNGGAAMADNFYDRNISKEYDDLDYDANEQFDDDDVNAGEEPEVLSDDNGFAGDIEEDVEDDEEYDSDGKGFASSAGFKDFMRKKEIVEPSLATHAGNDAGATSKARGDDPALSSDGGGKSSDDEINASRPNKRTKIIPEKLSEKETERFDADGLRTLSLDAVRKEIWLHHGQIKFKKLNKIFEIKKKTPLERRTNYMEIVKELCIIQDDKAEGKVLVLKQHYQRGL